MAEGEELLRRVRASLEDEDGIDRHIRALARGLMNADLNFLEALARRKGTQVDLADPLLVQSVLNLQRVLFSQTPADADQLNDVLQAMERLSNLVGPLVSGADPRAVLIEATKDTIKLLSKQDVQIEGTSDAGSPLEEMARSDEILSSIIDTLLSRSDLQDLDVLPIRVWFNKPPFQLYREGNMSGAAVGFLSQFRQGHLLSGVNAAYMLRRGEVPAELKFPPAVDLLAAKLAERDPYALVNQALCLAAGFQRPMDWEAADRILQSLNRGPGEIAEVFSWWRDLAGEGNAEGHLVIGWLARHGLIEDPGGWTIAQRMAAARDGAWQVPAWMDTSPDPDPPQEEKSSGTS